MAGTVELVRGAGAKVVSSADLVQKFEACWTPQQLESHLAAGKIIDRAIRGAFEEAAKHVRAKQTLTEYDLQQWFLKQFDANGISSRKRPGRRGQCERERSALCPDARQGGANSRRRFVAARRLGQNERRGQRLLRRDLDGLLGAKVPEKYAKVFGVLRDARNKAVDLILTNIAAGKPLQGWQVDKAARTIIDKAGYGKYFFHRLGHNIGETIHGNGANMDNLETHDIRHLIPKTCTSIEPGIYMPEFGMRTEVNVYIGERRSPRHRRHPE